VSTAVDAEALFDSAETISDDIEALEETRAPLFAVYGPGGTYEHERSTLISAIADELRLSAQDAGQKVTEALIEQRARADRRVLERVQLAREERTQMALIDTRINGKLRRFALAEQRMNTFRKLVGLT